MYSSIGSFTYWCRGSSRREDSRTATNQVILNPVHWHWKQREKKTTWLSPVRAEPRIWSSQRGCDLTGRSSPVLPTDSPLFIEGEPRVRLFWTPARQNTTESYSAQSAMKTLEGLLHIEKNDSKSLGVKSNVYHIKKNINWPTLQIICLTHLTHKTLNERFLLTCEDLHRKLLTTRNWLFGYN